MKSVVKHSEHVVQKVSLFRAVQMPASASQVARVVKAAQVSKE